MKVAEEKSLAEELGQITAQFYKLSLSSNTDEALNPSKFKLLKSIKHFMKTNSEGIKASDLGHHLEITPARITHMVNSLEKSGYVERISIPNDRRVVLIKLTEKGKEITEIISKKFNNLFSDLSNHLGQKDSKELIRLLKSTIEFFKERKKYATGK